MSVPATISLNFTNAKGGKFSNDEIFVFFNGSISGTINGTGESVALQTSYTFTQLTQGITVSSLAGRIYVALGEDFQKDNQGLDNIPNFIFQGTDPNQDSISVPWGFVEISYTPGAVSTINLTDVDFYAFPISVTTTSPGGTVEQLAYSVSGRQVESDLVGLVTATTSDKTIQDNTFRSTADGTFLRIISPVHMPQAYPSLQPYLTAVHQKYGTAVFATLEGQFSRFGPADNSCMSQDKDGVPCEPISPQTPYSGSGCPDSSSYACRYQTQTYQYTARFKSADINDNTLILEGGGACIGNTEYSIEILGTDLPQGIYTGTPAFTVNNCTAPALAGDNCKPPGPFDTNDVFTAGVRDIMAGFSFGFVENSANLGNNSKNWYGPPGITGASKAPNAFDKVNTSDPSTNTYFFNAYQWKVFEDSEAYGYPYSDEWQTVQAPVGDGYTVEVSIAAD